MSCQNWNLKPFQREVLDIFLEFVRICEKYKLMYFAIGGTALGAIRHKGFIPWDDDFDVALPREDFNKFVDVVRSELPAHLKFFRGGETKHSPIFFSKIINVRDDVILRMRRETGLDFDFSPFIDIFVIDGVPENVFELKKWWNGRRMLRFCQVYRYPQSFYAPNIKRKGIRFMLRVVGFFVSLFYPRTKNNEEMMRLMDLFSMRWSYGKSGSVTEVAFFKMKTSRIFPKNIFEPPQTVPFENTTICVPHCFDEYLRRFYGDYMVPPPVECQIPEHLFKKAFNHV